MTSKDWGNTDLSRQQQPTVAPASSAFSYTKLYLTIVAAILSAYFIMFIVSTLFAAALFDSFSKEMDRVFGKTTVPQQQNSSGFQRDLERLASNSQPKITPTINKQLERQSTQAKQQAAAKKSDLQTCTFWRDQYNKTSSKLHKMHMNTSCERAHGKLWINVN